MRTEITISVCDSPCPEPGCHGNVRETESVSRAQFPSRITIDTVAQTVEIDEWTAGETIGDDGDLEAIECGTCLSTWETWEEWARDAGHLPLTTEEKVARATAYVEGHDRNEEIDHDTRYVVIESGTDGDYEWATPMVTRESLEKYLAECNPDRVSPHAVFDVETGKVHDVRCTFAVVDLPE